MDLELPCPCPGSLTSPHLTGLLWAGSWAGLRGCGPPPPGAVTRVTLYSYYSWKRTFAKFHNHIEGPFPIGSFLVESAYLRFHI